MVNEASDLTDTNKTIKEHLNTALDSENIKVVKDPPDVADESSLISSLNIHTDGPIAD